MIIACALSAICWLCSCEEEPVKTGTITYKQDKVYDGYTLIGGTSVYDFDGTRVYQFPGYMMAFLKSGEIVATAKEGLARYDFELNIKWKKDIRIHHFIAPTPEGNILALSAMRKVINGVNFQFDVIYGVTKEGDIYYIWSCYDQLEQIHEKIVDVCPYPTRQIKYSKGLTADDYLTKLVEATRTEIDTGVYDYFHVNFVQVLPENPLAAIDTVFRPGNILMSFDLHSCIAIIDPRTNEVVWTYFHDLDSGQHTPQMLSGGNIIMYINSGRLDYGTVREINPLTKKVVWEYKGDPPKSFGAGYMGSCQRLPNGNTLISDNNKGGRVFEITKEKEIVWEWRPDLIDEETNVPINVYQAFRIPKKYVESFEPNDLL